MKDIVINVSKETRLTTLTRRYIGNDGENLQGNLIFQFDEYVKGIGRLEYIVGNTKSYVMLENIEDKYIVPIKSVLTKKGQTKMQLVITEDEKDGSIPVFKSNVFTLICNESINAEIERPDEYPQWIEVANTKLNELDNAIGGVQTIKNDIEGLKRETSILDTQMNLVVPRVTETINKVTDVETNLTNVSAQVQRNTNDIKSVDGYMKESISNINIDINELRNFKASKVEVENKQDKLIAGENITIKNNVISAKGGSSTSGIKDAIPYFNILVTQEEWDKAWEYQGDYEYNLSGILDRNNFMDFFNTYFDKDNTKPFGLGITVSNEWGNNTTYYKGTLQSYPFENYSLKPYVLVDLLDDEEDEEGNPHIEYVYQLKQEDFGAWTDDENTIHVIRDNINLVFGLFNGEDKPESIMYSWMGTDEILTINQ